MGKQTGRSKKRKTPLSGVTKLPTVPVPARSQLARDSLRLKNFLEQNRDKALRLKTGNFTIEQLHGHGNRIIRTSNGYEWVSASHQDAVLTAEEALQYHNYIQKLSVQSKYRSIKDNGNWRIAYGYKVGALPRTTNTGAPTIERCMVFPCHNCGFDTPVRSMEVDHFIPPAFPKLQILKALRLLGLTKAGASGGRRSVVEAILAGRDPTFLHPRGREPGTYMPARWESPRAKWTTTDKGDAFLSLLRNYLEERDLAVWCGNSIMNLAPLCAPCNKAKSDQVKKLVLAPFTPEQLKAALSSLSRLSRRRQAGALTRR